MSTFQRFDVGGVELCAKRWGDPSGRPVMALHGWIDNAASFDFLAPHLSDCDLVCLDCAGHGKSGRRNYLGAYNVWQDVGELFAVADQLGWSTFSLIGHSRGAMISMLAAGTFPSRISHLCRWKADFLAQPPPQRRLNCSLKPYARSELLPPGNPAFIRALPPLSPRG
jgi:pimeloyl-ACP methyl ester carboxylesterase